jgi:DNA polymerase-1
MVASYLLRPDRRQHGMDALAKELLGYDTVPIREIIGKGKTEISMLDADMDRLTEYAAEDADVTYRLYEHLSARFTDPALRKLFDDVEMPLVRILAGMEYHGVAIDRDCLREIAAKLETRIDALRSEIHAAAGRDFTIDSPKQLAEILFDEIGLRVVKKTKTSRSTDASVLETLALETAHPLPQLIIEYRELTKLLGTYLIPLPELISPVTGRSPRPDG